MTLERSGHGINVEKPNVQVHESPNEDVSSSVVDGERGSSALDQSLAREKRQSGDEDQFHPAEDGTSGLSGDERKVENITASGSPKLKGEIDKRSIPAKSKHYARTVNTAIESPDVSSLSMKCEDNVVNGTEQINQCKDPALLSPRAVNNAEPQGSSESEPIASKEDKSDEKSVLKKMVSQKDLKPGNDASDTKKGTEDEWQEMPALAEYDIYDDNGRLIARGSVDEEIEALGYNNLGSAAKGYTRVQIDEDAQSATSMDDNTAYLFKDAGKDLTEEDEEARNPMEQMQATKDLLTDGQRIAYVGTTRLAMMEMIEELEQLERTKKIKKEVDLALESMKMWSRKIMVRLHGHMDISSAGILFFLCVNFEIVC